MTREEKCLLAIERGCTYNAETGNIYNKFGKILKGKNSYGYVYIAIRINKKVIQLYGHHFAWYCVYGNCNIEQIDHINNLRDDNRINNLRSVTSQQNNFNRITTKGYYFEKNKQKYHARIKENGITIFLGLYNTEEEARIAYLNAKEKYHVI